MRKLIPTGNTWANSEYRGWDSHMTQVSKQQSCVCFLPLSRGSPKEQNWTNSEYGWRDSHMTQVSKQLSCVCFLPLVSGFTQRTKRHDFSRSMNTAEYVDIDWDEHVDLE